MATATITFYGGQGGGTFINLNASGVGFFGAAFGNSVQVGQYQDTSFVTNGAGSVEGPQLTNCKFSTPSGIIVDGDTAGEVQPSAIVVNSGTMNVRFELLSPATNVKTQNGEIRIFDRTTITNGATGVTTQVMQIVNGGSGVDANGTGVAPASHQGWIAPSGSGVIVNLLNSAGSGGLSPSGSDTVDSRHDWYACISATPLSIGSKTLFGIFVQLEYL